MSLIDRLSAGVSRKIRDRGREYHAAGVVTITHSAADFIEAEVEGMQTYEVALVREQDGLHVTCSCPYFDDCFQACKHIWATLLTADERGLMRAWEGTPARMIPEEPAETDGFEEDEFDEDYEEDRARTDRDLRLSRRMGGPAADEGAGRKTGKGVPAWKSAMRAIREETKVPWPVPVSGLKGRQIAYIVDAGLVLELGLCVMVGARNHNRDGKWGKPKTVSIGYESVAQLSDPADVQIIGRLLGVPRGRYGSSAHEFANLFKLTAPMSLEIMAMICETGRCLLRRPGSDLLHTLRFDSREPWEFRVEVRRLANPPHYRAEGFLVRGEERMPLSEPVVLLRDGLLIAGDSVARYEHHDSFGWIRVLRRDGPMMIPEEQKQSWLEELIGTSCLPRLDLPEELRFVEQKVTPRPRLVVNRPPYSGPASDLNATSTPRLPG